MKKTISALCVTTLLLNLSGCGTLLHPERNGQSRNGPVDVSIVLLDGIGLFFFIVPGVVAYAVDFIDGTIYLPNGSGHSHGLLSSESFDKRNMTAIHVGKENLTPEKIKEIVSANAGRDIDTENAQAYKIDASGKQVKVLM
jgi:hypothetical protein